MIRPAKLPIEIDGTGDAPLTDEAVKAIAALLIDAADTPGGRGRPSLTRPPFSALPPTGGSLFDVRPGRRRQSRRGRPGAPSNCHVPLRSRRNRKVLPAR
jgi:hypothetical protein